MENAGPEPIEPVELTAGVFRLRPWRPEDVDAVWKAFQDPDLRLWNGSGVVSREDALALVGRRLDWTSGSHASWVVVDDAGVLLGSVSLHSIDRLQNDAEIGYWTAAEARGRGIAAARPTPSAAGGSARCRSTGSSSATPSRTRPRDASPRRPASRSRAGCAAPSATATA